MPSKLIQKMISNKTYLTRLRSLMKDQKYVNEVIHAYIVPSEDAHGSEYIADVDKRRAFISGFTGSAGTAVITDNEALLWTDGRYYLQASEQLTSDWKLMKDGLPDTPSQEVWLSKNLPKGSRVGVDPKLISYKKWIPFQTQLETSGHELVSVKDNLIDLVWENQPLRPKNPIVPLTRKFTGKSVLDKLKDVNKQMSEKNAGALVITALDEIAWFLNLRGSDIQYNPVFFAYLVILPENFVLFIDKERYTKEVENHLKAESPGIPFEVKPYEIIGDFLKDLAGNINDLIWFSEDSNYFLISGLDKKKVLHTDITPIALMKAIKNEREREGMRNAHIKDAAALISYFAWLEEQILAGNTVTEVSGAKKLEEFRKKQEDFVGPSFDTISSVGPHGAIIHYSPSEKTDVPITANELYLCDSGGQYLDGTTDVTRTLHFGNPTEYEKMMFTLVLKGQLKLATTIFPKKIKGNSLDAFARQYLWSMGLDYLHGTGHGVGSYLNVHEGPMGIHRRNMPSDPGLEENMFLSNEPGYYEDGKFGIRLEDIVQIVPANTIYNFQNIGFCTFETFTLVPKQTKLIKTDMLTDDEIWLLNDYHQKCREVIGPVLEKQGELDAKKWLWRETEPIQK